MPKLLRIRFENIGHKDARLDPLILDFRDDQGEPADTVLWLRNGGGKSSILNLFFSVIRPGRREFLGSEAEGRVRRIEDYVAAEDTAHICIEWRLEEQPQARLLTGVNLEWRSRQRSSDTSRLRRLFYSVMVTPDAPITLDTLPIYHEKEGTRFKLLLAAFRDELRQLRDSYPQGNLFIADNLTEWQQHLISYGLDPELFRYQIRMNRREGAADELFRFRSPQEFVNFLIELALDPSAADKISENLVHYRESLLRRPRLEIEREFLQGLEEPLGDLVQLNQERQDLQAAIGTLKGRLHEILDGMAKQADKYSDEITALVNENQELLEKRAAGERDLTHMLDIASLLQCYVTGLGYREAENALRQAREELLQSQKQREQLIGAQKLYVLEKIEQTVSVRKEELSRQQKDSQPLEEQLEETGSRLFYLLNQQCEELQQRRTELREQLQELAERSHRALDVKVRLGQRYGELRSQKRSVEERLEQMAQERTRLESDHLLQPDETPAEAVTRYREELDALHAQLARSQAQQQECLQEEQRLAEQLRVQDRELAILEASRHELAKNIEQAKEWGQDLATNSFLKAFLEVEEIDVTTLGPEIIERLEKRSQALRDEAVRQQLDRAATLRALEFLESTGLLPPSRDVEEILNVLAQEDLPAHSGWSYLAHHYQPEEWRKRIRSHPDAVAGVIVAADYLKQARAILKRANLKLEGPVRLADPSIFDSTGRREGSVLGPTSRALFDRTAALEEKQVRQHQLARIDQQVQAVEAERQALDKILAQLQAFLSRTPASWFARQESLCADLQRKCENLQQEIAQIESQRQTISAQLATLNQQASEGRAKEIELQQAIHDLQHYQQHYADLEDQLGQTLQSLQLEEVDLEEEQNEIAVRLDELAQQEEEYNLSLVELEHELTLLHEELKRIEFHSHPLDDTPQAKELPQLRAKYQILLEQYAGHSGREALAAELKILRQKLKEEERAFQRYLKGKGTTRKEIGRMLAKIEDPENLAEQIEQCEEQISRLTLRVGNLENQAQQRSTENQEQMRRFQQRQAKRSRPITLEDQAVPQTAAEARQQAQQAFARVQQLEEQQQALATQLTAMEERTQVLQRRREHLKLQKKRVLEWQAHHKNLLDLGQLQPEVVSLPEDMAALEDLVDRFGKSLRQAGSRYEKLRRQLSATIETIRQWSRRTQFESLTGRIKERFLTDTAEDLLTQAKHYYRDLEIRQKILQETLEEIHRHRNLLVDETRDATVEAFRLLKRATEASRISKEIQEWEGLPFLKIHFTKPEHLEEERRRLGSLLDRLVQEGNIPKGVELIKKAMKVLVGNEFDVSLLKPDAVLRRHHESVTEMAAFSRGQQLTAAILIYCTLARLRSKIRGLPNAGASVLILDNPIGTCSNIQLLDLQHRIARAMDIQLVYTTGVNDLDALATLPNIIKLRNQHINRRGLRHVTLCQPPPGLSAVRVTRCEEAARQATCPAGTDSGESSPQSDSATETTA